jgi:hypothetical protein
MLPTREKNYTLNDLLDRLLDKGLVINADIIITLAGVPLIGVNLRAAIAGMDTMIKYGVMEDWTKEKIEIKDVESCPNCGIIKEREKLLNEGCECGWVSAKGVRLRA